jgi:hypothetical protein
MTSISITGAQPTGVDACAVLQSRRKALMEELASLMEEAEGLERHIRPMLETQYLQLFGPGETALLGLNIESRRLQRILDTVRRLVNRGQPITEDVIASLKPVLDQELADWTARLLDMDAAYHKAMRASFVPVDAAAQREMRRLYQKLVRLLHPDMVGADSPLYQSYWQGVQDAYASLDQGRLESLLVTVQQALGNESDAAGQESLDILQADIERLTRLIADQQARLAKLKASPPFCYAAKMADATWVQQKQAEMWEQVRTLEGRIATLRATIEKETLVMNEGMTIH